MGTNRTYWVNRLLLVSTPVLTALAERRLKETMPVESRMDRTECTYLEAIGRTLCGMAPWLELRLADGEENNLRLYNAELARRAIDAITDPQSADYGNFGESGQSLVDTAFLAHAFIRAPYELWERLESDVKANVIEALKKSRRIRPGFNNWLLFSAMVETGLMMMGEELDLMRIDYALRQHDQWYQGDGTYGDGPNFHWDYYNSYVIQPMLVDIITNIAHLYPDNGQGEQMMTSIIERARRYADIQERMIAPDGTFPAMGRSITYRCGAFHLLSQMAFRQELSKELPPAQVRCALRAVIQRCLDAPQTFDEKGWLRVGLSGHQPSLGESYISTGSLYLCLTAFLPLGLPPESAFWSDGDTKWTSQKIWSGMDMPADHSIK